MCATPVSLFMTSGAKILIGIIIVGVLISLALLWRAYQAEAPAERLENMETAMADGLEEVRGTVVHSFAGAGNFVMESETGQEWSISIDRFTQIYDEVGELVDVRPLPPILEVGTNILAIIDPVSDNEGTALLIRIIPATATGGEFFELFGFLAMAF